MAGTNPQMLIRIAANLEQLKKNLAEGKAQIEVTTAGMQKLAASLDGSKLEQKAHNITAAINEVGGASKLTDAEAGRLLVTLDAWIEKGSRMGKEIPPDILKTRDALKEVGDASKVGTSAFGDLVDQVKATALGFVSAQAIIGGVQTAFRTLTAFVGDSITSYATAEAAAKKMTTALQAQGTATPGVIQDFNDLGTQFQRTTVYSDDLITGMEALLTQVGNVAPANMGKALDAATNLASGLGIDLRDATLMVAKASEENVKALKKAGVQLDETRVAGEGMSYILDTINAKFGGQATGEAATYAGRVKQIANEWDNLKEAIGKAIVTDPLVLRVLDEVQGRITGIGESTSKYQPTISDWWAALASDRYAALAVGYMNSVDQAIQDINRDLLKMPATPKAFLPDDGGLLARMKKESDDLIDSTIKGWTKAADAAKKWGDTLEAAFRKWSGRDLAEQAKVLDITFRRMADSGQITEQQLRAMAAEAAKLAEQGATLSPRLWAIVEATGQLDPALTADAAAFARVGTAIDLVIPKLSGFNQAVLELQGKTIWGTSGLPEMGFKVTAGLDNVIEKTKTETDQLGRLSQAFAQLSQVAGGSLGDIVRDFGTIVASADTAAKSIGSIKSGFSKGGFSGILEATTGILGLASAAISAGKAIANLFDRNKGRDLVKDFAASMGGFDALQQKLLQLGPDYEKLWRSLTQLGNNASTKEAQAAIDAVTAALERQKTATVDAAQAAVESGAKQAQAQQEVLDAITAKYADTISKLDSEYKSLNDSVSQEAEEAVMGVVETQQRARMEQIKAEKAAQEAMRDAEIDAKKMTFEQWVKDGAKVQQELEQIFSKPLEIPYSFVPQNSPWAPGEPVPSRASSPASSSWAPGAGTAPASASGGAGSAEGAMQITLVMPDGDVLLKQTVKAGQRRGWM